MEGLLLFLLIVVGGICLAALEKIKRLPDQILEKLTEKLREEETRKQAEQNSGQENE